MSEPKVRGHHVFPLSLLLLGACAIQPAYRRPAVTAPSAWSNGDAASPATEVDRDSWWLALRDPAIDVLAATALRDNPTLEQAAARIDQARAVLAARGAARLPTIGVAAGAAQSRDRMGAGTATVDQTSASLGLTLSWEIDLWGRVREGRAAARARLAARVADADGARLSVVGDIADTVLALRACDATLAIRDRDIASRETELRIARARLGAGSIAPLVVAGADGNLAAARTDRIVQAEACLRLLDALTALSGMDGAGIRAVMPPAAPPAIPSPPVFVPALPATVLLANPGVVAAEREAAARWAEIGVARAERLPRLDLAAALTGQWLRAFGSSTTYASNSASLALAGPLFDGGAGAASVRGAGAAYREAAAQLVLATRVAARDVEDGLAAQQSALARIDTTRDAVAAAGAALRANEARWRAGAIAAIELEESRRLFRRAEESAVVAAADRARAWVALVRRTGRA